MKAERKIDELGRLVMPKKMTDALNIKALEKFELVLVEDGIFVKPIKKHNCDLSKYSLKEIKDEIEKRSNM